MYVKLWQGHSKHERFVLAKRILQQTFDFRQDFDGDEAANSASIEGKLPVWRALT